MPPMQLKVASRFPARRREATLLAEASGYDRCSVASSVDHAGPCLHQSLALRQVLCVVVGSSDLVAVGMCELALNHVRPEAGFGERVEAR